MNRPSTEKRGLCQKKLNFFMAIAYNNHQSPVFVKNCFLAVIYP